MVVSRRLEIVSAFGDSPYDEGPEPEEFYEVKYMPGLSEAELDEALDISKMMRGVMVVSGAIGSGKGVFSTWLAWKMRTYFGKRVLLDFKPRRLFGEYTYFNEARFISELAKMSVVATGEIPKEGILKEMSTAKQKAMVKELTKEWMSSQGQVMLQNSVIVLDEFWRYMDKRRPHNPMGLLLGGLLKLWRHLDALIIGITPRIGELDEKRCIPYLTHEVRCSWAKTVRDTAICRVIPIVDISNDGVVQYGGKSKKWWINGRTPRERLNGEGYFKLFNSKSAVAMSPRIKHTI